MVALTGARGSEGTESGRSTGGHKGIRRGHKGIGQGHKGIRRSLKGMS